MATVRDVLNEMKWRDHALNSHVTLWYVHRGAPGDARGVRSSAVIELGRSFIDLHTPNGRTRIPYHRFFRIDRGGSPVWQRTPSH